VKVVISHPKLVETGLDLLDFPTIIFYCLRLLAAYAEASESPILANRPERPVRVKFLCYEGTMQTAYLRLMGKKLPVALTMEGKFTGEGLQNIDEDYNMLSAMARELVERNGIGGTADAVWKALNAENRKLFPTTTSSSGDIPIANPPSILIENQFGPACLVESAVENTSIVAFGQRPDSLSGRRRRPKPVVPEQASLFSFS
jgi:hypothetical protein